MGLVFAGVSFYFFILSPIFRIKEISISGNNKVKIEAIKEAIQTGNIFLVNFEKIRKEILKKFPQIAEVNLKRKFPDKLNLIISEREAVANFCGDTGCFSLDKDGVIFEKSSPDSPLLKIKKTEDGPLLESNLVSFILEIELKLKYDLKILVEEILVLSEDRLNIKTVEGWEIYFNPKNDLNWQLTKLKAVLENEIPQAKRKNLEYIDLRFGNLAPYKYR